ncbi:hypothetical protein V6N11_083017 [Hibiscus sabdariffa]|uniref:Uncharacterized protein n=1 Tax=Hibiscus sabdariffa TaxID=183260 RepID=A0ABR2QKS3_9ROSI
MSSCLSCGSSITILTGVLHPKATEDIEDSFHPFNAFGIVFFSRGVEMPALLSRMTPDMQKCGCMCPSNDSNIVFFSKDVKDSLHPFNVSDIEFAP